MDGTLTTGGNVMQIDAATVENIIEVPHKVKNRNYHIIQQSEPLAYIIWKRQKPYFKKIYAINVPSITIYRSQEM